MGILDLPEKAHNAPLGKTQADCGRILSPGSALRIVVKAIFSN